MNNFEKLSQLRAEEKGHAIRNIEKIKALSISILAILIVSAATDIYERSQILSEKRFEKAILKANVKYDNMPNQDEYKRELQKLVCKNGFFWDMKIDHPCFDDSMTLNQIADSNDIPFCLALRSFRAENLGE